MNGFVSTTPLRSRSYFSPVSAILAGSCFFVGFAIGFQNTSSANLATKTIKPSRSIIEKIAESLPQQEIKLLNTSWALQLGHQGPVQLDQTNENAPPLAEWMKNELAFVPYSLPQRIVKKSKPFHYQHAKQPQKIADIKSTNLFSDFLRAAKLRQEKFHVASNVFLNNEYKVKIYKLADKSSIEIKPNSVKVSIQAKKIKTIQNNTKQKSVKIARVQQIKQVKSPVKQEVITVSRSSASKNISEQKQQGLSIQLQDEIKNKLIDEQLKEQLKQQNIINSKPYVNKTEIRHKKFTHYNNVDNQRNGLNNETDTTNNIDHYSFNSKSAKIRDCYELNTHKYLIPNTTNIQFNPQHYKWISKNASIGCTRGWVKVEDQQIITTLLMHQASSQQESLLIDQNSLALLSLKMGVRVSKGSGVIIGNIIPDYQVEFLGRSEEPVEFETHGKKYFAILNAEPSAGVLQITHKNNPKISATVFVPVLADTVTSLDLDTPTLISQKIKLVKSGSAGDPDVSSIRIRNSMNSQIQAITNKSGYAEFSNFYVMPGYPYYIDSESKLGQQSSYTYRYELWPEHFSEQNTPVQVIYQTEEKLIYKWLTQVKNGISDQSGLVIGFVQPKRLKGFSQHFYAKLTALTDHNLEPETYRISWDGKNIDSTEPLEADRPRYLSVQIPDGVSQVQIQSDSGEDAILRIIPISPRVIHVLLD